MEDMQSENAGVSQAEVHKGSGVAVDNAKWFIAECKETRERTCRTMLQNENYEVYLASRVETHIYKSRNRRKVERIVIPRKLFVYTEEANLMKILMDHSSIYRFMLNKAATPNAHGHYPFAYVPDSQMKQLQYVLGHAENPVSFTAEDLALNQKVRVMRGPLQGMEAYFYEKGHTSYIVVKVEMGTRHYAYTEVPIEDVQPVRE